MEKIREYITGGEYDQQFRRDGVVCLRGVLTAAEVEAARQVFEWYRANPGPTARQYYPDTGGLFLQEGYNFKAWPMFEQLCQKVPYGDIVTGLWNSEEAWFFADQIFVKEGEGVRRTPWHQDITPVYGGSDLAVVWMSFDPVPKENALEFVRGSHQNTIYNQPAFDPEDDTKPLFAGDLPQLPNIEAERHKWDIVSWATEPGDLLIFHHATLHGGAKTDRERPRRTLVTRFIGEDAWRLDGEMVSMYTAKDSANDTELVAEVSKLMASVPVGKRMNTNPAFFRVPLLRERHPVA